MSEERWEVLDRCQDPPSPFHWGRDFHIKSVSEVRWFECSLKGGGVDLLSGLGSHVSGGHVTDHTLRRRVLFKVLVLREDLWEDTPVTSVSCSEGGARGPDRDHISRSGTELSARLWGLTRPDHTRPDQTRPH